MSNPKEIPLPGSPTTLPPPVSATTVATPLTSDELNQAIHILMVGQNNLQTSMQSFIAHAQATTLAQREDPEKIGIRKLQEKDPEFDKYNGNLDQFLGWLVLVQEKKRLRAVPDQVAIRYAQIVLGEFGR